MLIEGLNYRMIGDAPSEILQPIIDACKVFDWKSEKYNQPPTSGALAGGKTLEFPFISQHPATKFRPYTSVELELLNTAVPLFDFIQEFLGYPILLVRCEFATLMARSKVKWHIDNNHKFFAYCKRIHIPITTNLRCEQLWEDESTRFNPGSMYEYNNQVKHCASNNGETSRTTIILDIIKEIDWEALAEAGVFNKLLKDYGTIRKL